MAAWPEHEGHELGPSSIGWLTWHMTFWWESVVDRVTRDNVLWPGSAEAVIARIVELQVTWRTHDDLRSSRHTRWPFQTSRFATSRAGSPSS